MELLNPGLKKLHTHNLTVRKWVMFLQTKFFWSVTTHSSQMCLFSLRFLYAAHIVVHFCAGYFLPHCGCIFTARERALASSFPSFLEHIQWRVTFSRTPLDEWSIRRRDLYLTTPNTHNRQTSIPPVGFEPTISADKRLKTYALDRAATGTSTPEYVKLGTRRSAR